MSTGLMAVTLGAGQFQQIRDLLYRICRINLQPGREKLVEARLSGRLRTLGLKGFDDYIRFVEDDPSQRELAFMVDALTTNKTSFFREMAHFDFLRDRVLPVLREQGRPLRFWCAGCSSGEEPYSLAMLLVESLPDIERRDVEILATDISSRVLASARLATFPEERLQGVDERLRKQYFQRVPDAGVPCYKLDERLAKLVYFARLNLMEPWPMRGPFDLIFCRNVMIYFDTPTRELLVQRYYDLLRPGGHLFIGHSESLSGHTHPFSYVQPATYTK